MRIDATASADSLIEFQIDPFGLDSGYAAIRQAVNTQSCCGSDAYAKVIARDEALTIEFLVGELEGDVELKTKRPPMSVIGTSRSTAIVRGLKICHDLDPLVTHLADIARVAAAPRIDGLWNADCRLLALARAPVPLPPHVLVLVLAQPQITLIMMPSLRH